MKKGGRKPVSYTHLDVYKRQLQESITAAESPGSGVPQEQIEQMKGQLKQMQGGAAQIESGLQQISEQEKKLAEGEKAVSYTHLPWKRRWL